MGRVTIRTFHPRKFFYERVLREWKKDIRDWKYQRTLTMALVNLKCFPLEVESIGELKRIKGIGDRIAERLDSAWECFCSSYPNKLTVKELRSLKSDDILRFLSGKTCEREASPSSPNTSQSTSLNEIEKRLGNRRMRSAALNVPCETSTSAALASNHSEMDNGHAVTADSSTIKTDVVTVHDDHTSVPTNKSTNTGLQRGPSQMVKLGADLDWTDETSKDLLFYSPTTFESSQIILLIDNAEHGHRRRKLPCEHIKTKISKCKNPEALKYSFEMRTLSVGDYMWIIRLPDGRELVMDYIVERKTDEDLLGSITEARYQEQKQRLMNIGIANVIYLLEGNASENEKVSQALVTTSVLNKFLVYCTKNAQDTAKFLTHVTERLVKRAKRENILGMNFETFQRLAKKTQRMKVSKVFVRQLTVCPQMSVQKAMMIAEHFPSFSSLAGFYQTIPHEDRPLLISNHIPGVPISLSMQLAKFFENA